MSNQLVYCSKCNAKVIIHWRDDDETKMEYVEFPCDCPACYLQIKVVI